MIVADAPKVYGYTIFCDDIRVEVGGKLTYVGVYPKAMIVQGKFPLLLLPRFAIHFFYSQEIPHVIPPSRIIVVAPGATEENPTFAADISQEEGQRGLVAAELQASHDGIESKRLLVQGPITLTNFVITQPGSLKVRAVRGEELIRLGTLEIRQDPRFVDAQTDGASGNAEGGGPGQEMKEAAN